MRNNEKVFAERLARIAAHAGNTNATLHIGMEDQLPQAALARGATLPKVDLGGVSLAGLMVPLALASGGLAWVWAHWARVTVVETGDPLMALGADLGAGLIVMLLLRLALGFTGMATLLAQALGALAGFALLHNAVHLWPEHFGLLFPQIWVETVLASTQPMSISLAALLLP